MVAWLYTSLSFITCKNTGGIRAISPTTEPAVNAHAGSTDTDSLIPPSKPAVDLVGATAVR